MIVKLLKNLKSVIIGRDITFKNIYVTCNYSVTNTIHVYKKLADFRGYGVLENIESYLQSSKINLY